MDGLTQLLAASAHSKMVEIPMLRDDNDAQCFTPQHTRQGELSSTSGHGE
ncbi:hypothetical protein KCP71_12690 [Salmonella enterica subsp. enterica]|nr:hypothetical protein KCP71_12690 [Salmonella enterica subsp. enterica]